MQGSAVRSTLVVALSGLVAVVAMVGGVVAAFVVLDDLDAITDGDSLRAAVAAGMVALVGAYLGVRAVLVRVLPLRRIEYLVPLPYLVSAAVAGPRIRIVCSAPELAGRVVFQTAEPSEVLLAIQRAKAR